MSIAIHALSAGTVAPESDDGDRANDPRHQVQANQPSDSAGDAALEQLPAADHKRLATVRAELARIGHVLEELPGGGYRVSRWALCRDLRELRDVEAFAQQVGARK